MQKNIKKSFSALSADSQKKAAVHQNISLHVKLSSSSIIQSREQRLDTHTESATTLFSFELFSSIRYQSCICRACQFNCFKFLLFNPDISVFVQYLQCSSGKLSSQAFFVNSIVQRLRETDARRPFGVSLFLRIMYWFLPQRWEDTLLWNKCIKKKWKKPNPQLWSGSEVSLNKN